MTHLLDQMHAESAPAIHDAQQATRVADWSSNTRQAIKAVRGLMVLLVIAAHWGPFFIDHSGSIAGLLNQLTNPVFRLGTPGFALIFGLRIGFNLTSREAKSKGYIASQMKRSVRLLGQGIIAFAIVQYFALSAEGVPAGDWPQRAFYTVLSFYFIAALVGPEIFPALMRSKNAIGASLIFAALSLLTSTLLRFAWHSPTTGWLHLVQSLTLDKYGFFEMMSYVLVGFATGIWLEKSAKLYDSLRMMRFAGAGLFIAGITMSMSTGIAARWFTNRADDPAHPMLVTYVGVFFLLITLAARANETLGEASIMRKAYKMLCVFGTLSLSAYVGHTLVIPLGNILAQTGLSHLLAVSIMAAGFVILFAARTYRRYRAIFIDPISPQE
ncbi:acyltransferase [Sphingomonas faeni]|uniref:acyltransferase n=1 Tax=Sphingomonas faeni TaxID=185950 RepID=UPI0020BDEF4D|nr:acyltransferase [Sphingomonas faeni]MCK8458378.1 acyltransferase [Sphingomonas faeni]